jgi:hypothetical protein
VAALVGQWEVVPVVDADLLMSVLSCPSRPSCPISATGPYTTAAGRGRGGPQAIPMGHVALYLGARSVGSILLAPAGGWRWCRPADAVKVERSTGRTTLTPARTGAECSPRRGRR